MSVAQFFSASGPLSELIKGYQPRQPQLEMAQAVSQSIKDTSALLVEAETGTGKTFAYLAPALVHGKRTVISTGSKNLQEQLYLRDLPLLLNASGFTGVVALLKGRNNYLCLERMNRFMLQSHQQDTNLLADLVKVKTWSASSEQGDIGELAELAEDADIIPLVTSTNDNCLGRDCPSYDDCYLIKARKRALEADVLVVNHHLFFADLAVKDTGFGELIPDADVYIFDEAHQLPDIASQYFGESLSSRQLFELCKDMDYVYRAELRDMAQLGKACDRFKSSIQELRIAFNVDKGSGSWRDKLRDEQMKQAVARFMEAMQLVYEVAKLGLNRSEVLDHCFERLVLFKSQFEKLLSVDKAGFSYWFDCNRMQFSLNITPLSVATRFASEMAKRPAAWVFTSATLAVDQKFDHFAQLLGLADAQTLLLKSPFDYAQQSLLAVPRFLPEPGGKNLAPVLAKLLAPIIAQNKGRCFFLCTSHYMMNELANSFRELLDLPVLVQGEGSKQALLNEFIDSGNALLVATGAFWEGIDVRGQGLSLVIIDKIPFASPDDPLLKARMEDAQLKGLEPFQHVQLPQAVITLKQGVGRLIRDVEDKGAVIICDPRLVSRNYGNIFLNSLPCMPRTRDLTKVTEFLQHLD
ncbi:ATP-dependent DNA helicase [Motilimonas sp. 1_MG-2023]|uniref:ATP-dependent DNA helicase n=1 Tax=Motilimonas sp. 1_MG-2023 TaxID=3062672 RepID=UPI0026E3AEC2|nr:ATP-dependent DNA helicase [Motilimonas sp. 1_MG-2023]MDO6526197.1 ATP-dependent DNA helicase [Motilimonas sp. 1_MG-2023]